MNIYICYNKWKDWQIEAIFLTKPEAQAYCQSKGMDYEFYNMETETFDFSTVKKVKRAVIDLKRNGKVIKCEIKDWHLPLHNAIPFAQMTYYSTTLVGVLVDFIDENPEELAKEFIKTL